jgi:hypothetical protein
MRLEELFMVMIDVVERAVSEFEVRCRIMMLPAKGRSCLRFRSLGSRCIGRPGKASRVHLYGWVQ